MTKYRVTIRYNGILDYVYQYARSMGEARTKIGMTIGETIVAIKPV